MGSFQMRVSCTLAAFGITAVARARTLTAQTDAASAKPGMIDVHNHIAPPSYLPENRDRLFAADGGRISPAYLNWTPEQALAVMDKIGIATAVLAFGGWWRVRRPGNWHGAEHLPTDTKRERQNTRFNVPSERPMVTHLGVEMCARLS